MKKFLLPFLFLLPSWLFAQNVHPHFEDGKLYLKIKEMAFHFRGLDDRQSAQALQVILNKELNMAGVASFSRMFSKTKHPGLDNIFKLEISDPQQAELAIRILASNPNVEYAEKVPLKKYFFNPNDTLYSNSLQWNLFKVNASLAWNYVTPGTQATIAVIDEGIDILHPDLQANIWTNNLEIPNDGIDNDGNFYVDDVHTWDFGDADNTVLPLDSTWNHGTHVAGIASAVSNNVTGIASIGYNCRIMAVKGSSSNLFMSNGYEAIVYAAENGADVINLSWGGPAYSITENSVIEFAYYLNCLVVAASGNDGTDQVNYPAGYSHAMSVASTGPNDVRVFSSNYGPWIDICAPGIDILSTITGGGYGLKTGTSMAAPMVAGLAGLMRSYHPGISARDLENCIKSTADNIDFMNPNLFGRLGAGRINAFNAMSCVVSSRYQYDVWVEGLENPASWTCNPQVNPIIRIRNHGTDTLTEFRYHYRIDQGPYQSALWNGSAVYDSIFMLTLPPQALGSGRHTIDFYVSWPNGVIDWNLFNDTIQASFEVLAAGLNAPFHESFDDTSATRNLWAINNPDQAIGWQIKNQLIGSQNTGLAWINLFNYSSIGEKDAIISPPLNLDGLDSAWVSFNYASRVNWRSNGFDTLRVFLSNDCGQNFFGPVSVLALDSMMATSSDTSNTFFRANTQNDWCDSLLSAGCFNINLSQYTGQQSLSVMIEITNRSGNNFYLDDFRFNGISGSVGIPQPQITLDQNLVCAGGVISMSGTSAPAASSWQWVVQGASPDTVIGQNAIFRFDSPGTYSVQLKASNASGNGTATLNAAISVSPLPSVQIISDSNIVCLGDSLQLSVNGAAAYTWQSDGQLSGNNGSTVFLLGVSPGEYTVTLNAVTGQGCSAQSSSVYTVTSCLGLEDRLAAAGWRAWYDAGEENIMIEKSSQLSGMFQIYSVSGQKLMHGIAPEYAERVLIPVSQLAKGLYIIRFSDAAYKVMIY